MGSSFFGRPKMGGSSSSSPTSSPAKRGKNKNGSDKPKQPQRGLGVAQLEKIRLHSELNCNSFNTYPSYHPSTNNDQDQRNKLGSGIQMNFETSDATEPDLELRLSL
ncbi:hypothetical protein HID58_000790 [Brassica napus]|uniref:Protein SPEAR3-like n=1 Tax=Brassica napus TaxID=3708 RepID=A0ABQ8EK86_BRANA|nr:hypothetical protein HID58_000790 [Brassica napus]